MTPAGNSILEEYVNEIKERIDDDKNKIYLEQGKNAGYMVWRAVAYIPTGFFLGIWMTATCIMLLGIAEPEIFTSLRGATDEELAEGFRIILYFGMFFSIVCPGFIAIRYYRNKRDERLWSDQVRVWEKRDRIELIEEVLLRHGLIEKTTVETSNESAH